MFQLKYFVVTLTGAYALSIRFLWGGCSGFDLGDERNTGCYNLSVTDAIKVNSDNTELYITKFEGLNCEGRVTGLTTIKPNLVQDCSFLEPEAKSILIGTV